MKIKELKLRITDMHCSSCALTIDMDLEELGGVQKVQTSYAKCECNVEFNPEKISNTQIVETIKKSGYTVVLDQ